MRRTTLMSLALGLISTLGVASTTGPATGGARTAFDRLKQLEGQWLAKGTDELQSVFRVTAGGTAILETLFPGTDHEMLTVYAMDGDDLRLTHYCVMGNQPQMKAAAWDGTSALAFQFDGGTSLDPAHDMHMHSARMTFLGPDALRAEWVLFEGEKEVETRIFELVRKQ